MKKLVLAALIAFSGALPVAAQQTAAASAVTATVSRPLFDVDGKRIGNVYKVAADGSPQVINNDGRLVTIPAGTLSEVDGKLTTSLKRRDLSRR